MKGYDFLALGHRKWPVKDTIKALPKGSAIGCFHDTFGNVINNLKKVCDSGKVKAVRVHIWWSDSHELVPIKNVQDAAPIYQKFALDYPSIKFYVSFSCEHKSNNKIEIQKRVDTIKKLAPHCIPVNCFVEGKGIELPGVISETHGAYCMHDIASMDGTEINNYQRWRDYHKTCLLAFQWTAFCNMREIGKPAPPPKLRSYVPTFKQLKEFCDR